MTTVLPSPFNPKGTPTEVSDGGKRRAELIDLIDWLERLNANADFQKYLDIMREGARATRRYASDIHGTPAETRDAYSQKHYGLMDMIEWPEEYLAGAKLQLDGLNEKAKPV